MKKNKKSAINIRNEKARLCERRLNTKWKKLIKKVAKRRRIFWKQP